LTVDSLNGLRNRATTAGQMREAEPEFLRVLGLLREVQAAGAVGMRIEQDKAREETAVLFFRPQSLPPEVLDKLTEVRRLLGAPPDQSRFRITYAPARAADDELAVTTRSMLQILAAFALFVEAPDEDVREGRAAPVSRMAESEQQASPPRIRCSAGRPSDAFVAVEYRGRWFWIDDRDWRAKRAFSWLLLFFTLVEGAAPEQLPLITIPAG
jgi:hypothetical protein